jgi:hypothetical protein
VKAKEEDAAEVARSKADAIAQEARLAHTAAVAAVNKIQIPSALPCPHCGATIDARHNENDDIVFEKSSHSMAQIVGLRADLDKARQVELGTRKRAQETETLFNQADAHYQQVRGSKVKLSTADQRRGNQDAVDLARDALAGHQRDKARVEARLRCVDLQLRVARNQKVVDILSPEGLRRQKLAKALSAFNKDRMAPLCTSAGFEMVSVDEDLEVLYGSRPYFLLSASEQYRVRAVLQLAIAALDGSPVVILDGADMLDQEGREGLFGMLAEQQDRGFLVGMTMDEATQAPNLKEAGMGTTYWVDGGIAKEVS